MNPHIENPKTKCRVSWSDSNSPAYVARSIHATSGASAIGLLFSSPSTKT